MYSFPVTVDAGRVAVVPDLPIASDVRERMEASERELIEERDAVAHLLGVGAAHVDRGHRPPTRRCPRWLRRRPTATHRCA
jgi:hypothetical protein